ncbi:MAG: hypothetical protein N2510_01695 [Ignavibacteria bacterium]|nr:hypothetical protein [Ignavibacteria bacterium]
MYIRKCFKYDFSKLSVTLTELKSPNFEFYIDEVNYEEIIQVLENNPKKTRRILYEISQQRYNDELYEKLRGYNNITALVYKGKTNMRVYCKEYKQHNKKIVAVVAVHKKSYKINKNLKSTLDLISKYEYTFL